VKRMTVILALALSGITLASDFAPASANRMNGRCCQSSDNGRSYRYRVAVMRAAIPRTCSAYADLCIRLSSTREDRVPMCHAAKLQCIGTGTFFGPYSGMLFADMTRQ
jgi:hypothetical protein